MAVSNPRPIRSHQIARVAPARRIAWHCITATIAIALCSDFARSQQTTNWSLLTEILQQVQSPQFPDQDFPITDFGAVADGETDCKPAIDQAVQQCEQAGGGRVLIPRGDWYVGGPIHLRSNVNLHLEEDAHVRFSHRPDDYLPVVMTRFEGTELMNFSPLIYAIDKQNVAITGHGTFDGQAGPDHWWPWKRNQGGDTDQTNDVKQLTGQADEGVPVNERVFGQGHKLRSSFIQFYRCKHVLIEGVKVTNAPMWNIHPVLCTNVTVRGVNVESHGPNNDGCNPESCRNVLIEECRFNTGDDCIAIKSGRNAEGRRIGVPSENIVVRKCDMADGHGGVVLGSEMSGGIRNVFVEDCRMSSPNLERAIRLKSNSLRGGYLENLFVRNIDVGEVSRAVIHINLEYANETGEYAPTVKNVLIENVTSEKSKMPLYMVGLEGHAIENVQIKNCTFKNTKQASVIEHVRDIRLTNVTQPR